MRMQTSENIREHLQVRVYVFSSMHLCVPLYGSAMRHEGISKCTGSRNNAKSHGCVYIVVHERAAWLRLISAPKAVKLLILFGRFLRTDMILFVILDFIHILSCVTRYIAWYDHVRGFSPC